MSHPRYSRTGISLFEGDVRELDGKVRIPGALMVAQWEGLELTWDYERDGDVLVLYLSHLSEIIPALRIPLTQEEIQILDGHREKGGWGYYELRVEENDDRAATNVSFHTAKDKPMSLLWILDRKRRDAVRKALSRVLEEPLGEV